MVEKIKLLEFLWPYAILIAPLPLILRKWGSNVHWSKHSIYFPRISRLSTNNYQMPQQSPSNLTVTFWAIWILLTIALLRPALVKKYAPIQQEGYNIVLAVDLSGSMAALDYSTRTRKMSRLDAVRQVLKNHFVSERDGDRIGMVVFAKDAYIYSPLTYNHNTISKMLDYTKIGMAGESTSIGDAIAVSVKAFANIPENNRILILLTDGQDTSSQIAPVDAAKIARDNNIRIYTIGMGSDGLVPIPIESGQVVMGRMPLDEDTLKEIARTTNGIYLRANSLDELGKIYKNISQLEKTNQQNDKYVSYESLHHVPLFFILVILILSLIRRFHANYVPNIFSKF